MGRIATRSRDKSRAKSPTFCFSTKALRGEPRPDTTAEQESKAKAIDQFKRTRGITKCPAVSRGSVGG